MLVSVVVPEKLPGQKRCDEEAEEEEEEHQFLGVFDVFYSNTDMTICNFFDVYVFILWRTAH